MGKESKCNEAARHKLVIQLTGTIVHILQHVYKLTQRLQQCHSINNYLPHSYRRRFKIADTFLVD